MGETHKSKAQCSACMSLCATLGPTPHQKQTLEQMELFIQLYTLFGRHMSFSDWETICCVSWWITNFELSLLFRGWWGYIYNFYRQLYCVIFFFFFFRSNQRHHKPIKLLIIANSLWNHSWTLSWPSKWDNYLESNYLDVNKTTAHLYLPFPHSMWQG